MRVKWYETETGRAVLGVCRGLKRVVLRAIFHGLRSTQAYGFTIRPGTSDLWTVMETFERKIYLPLCTLSDVRVIVDLGANIGDTAVFFAQHYPHAKVIAVECDDSNYQLLLTNIKKYPNIIPVKAAIWSQNKRLYVGQGKEKNAIYTYASAADKADAEVEVQGVTMDELMRNHQLQKIDVLKIDIEGAEKELFEHDCSWLSDVQAIGIEFHDQRIKGCTTAFFKAMSNHFHGMFTLSQWGETFIVKRLDGSACEGLTSL